MKHIALFLLTALPLVGAACTINRVQPPPRTVTVTGSGTAVVEPDHAVMQFAVITQNRIAENAAQENSRIMTAVIEAIQNAGVKNSDIFTERYNLEQQNTWSASRLIAGPYLVNNTVRVTVRNIAEIGAIIDAAIGAGANGLTALSFDSADKATALRQARTLALQDAQSTAALYAGSTGGSLGQIISITENYTNGARFLEAAADRSTPIMPSGIPVSASITVIYALQ